MRGLREILPTQVAERCSEASEVQAYQAKLASGTRNGAVLLGFPVWTYREPLHLSARKGKSAMADTLLDDKTKQQIRHLRELIAALDKRQPRIERVGETEIARDAAALKKKALQRLAELQGDVEQ
jgi:hypothetical protein